MRIVHENKIIDFEPNCIKFGENKDGSKLINLYKIELETRDDETYLSCLSRHLLDYSMPEKKINHDYYLLGKGDQYDFFIPVDKILNVGKNMAVEEVIFYIEFYNDNDIIMPLYINPEKIMKKKTKFTNIFDYIFENIYQFDFNE